jgi:hypothetical protein
MTYPRTFPYFLRLWSKYIPQLVRYKIQMKPEADLDVSERSIEKEGTNDEENH